MDDHRALGLGLIGCGAFGRFCLDAFSEMEQVRIAAVADARGEVADQLARDHGVPAYSDPASLIASRDVQIVHIATPPSSHHELALAAARAGKHILCEKPLAMNLRQADAVLAASREAGVLCPVNFVLRHNPVTDAVKRIIDCGVLGEVLAGRLTNCAKDTPLPADHWFWDQEVSGGIFIEHGVHFFDLYSYWLGAGTVIGAHAEVREATAQEDRVLCMVRHDTGAVVTHYHGFDQITPMDRADHRMVCEMGDIRVEGWIPLSVSVDAAVDDEGAERLAAAAFGGSVEILERYPPDGCRILGRGKTRRVTQRIRLHYAPQLDKQSLYAESLRQLLADQVAAIRDRTHVRRITERNGRDALVLAVAATEMARARMNAK
ncbi:MAG TPA: Gfo/Idh/MocA family oxidoreductase [Phycisphaerae bacterium]|nr:Gfo/Idh/MocA family oxidoreductase [Phycisphaerae bacterium]